MHQCDAIYSLGPLNCLLYTATIVSEFHFMTCLLTLYLADERIHGYKYSEFHSRELIKVQFWELSALLPVLFAGKHDCEISNDDWLSQYCPVILQ